MPTEEPFDIVALGHIVQETIRFPDRESELMLGSPAAYSMVAAGRLGGRAGVVSTAGPDLPKHLLEPFQDANVTLHLVRGSRTTSTRLIYHEDGTKTIEYPAKADPIRPEDVPASLRSARLFYDCPMDHDLCPETLDLLKSTGALLAADLGGYGGAHVRRVERPRGLPDRFTERMRRFDLVKASDEDCRRLMADPETVDEELGRRLLEMGPSIVLLTRGEDGTVVLTPEERIEVPPFRGNPVDPTGAGDTFMGGFLTAYLRTADLEYAARFGSATALLVIEKTGGVRAERMPTTEMVEECMKRAVRSR